MTQSRSVVRRRTVLKAAAAISAPYFVPAHVLGQNAPSNTLRIGSIGTGRMGRGDMREAVYRGLDSKLNARVVAVADVNIKRAQQAKDTIEDIYEKKLGAGKYESVKAYQDFRELLARDDIDGVTISTPDHQHALCGVAAANAGKDIYIQKPFTYSIVEGQKLVAAVRKNKVVLQTGSQQRSDQRFRRVCELVRNEYIGKLQSVEVVIPTDRGRADPAPMPVPENLNYDLWMGPTSVEPYCEARVHSHHHYNRPGWLQIEKYCRGMITGWGAHMYDIAQWGLGTDFDSGPISITAKGEFPDRGLFDVHVGYSAEAEYANGVKMISHNGDAGVKFIGDKAWVWVTRGKWDASDKDILRTQFKDSDIHLSVSRNHMMNFLECMRTRKDPIAPAEVGHRSNSVCVIHHIAMKLGRKLQWDPKTEQFVNDAEANKMLDFDHREPYTV
ncbi:Gfo/Idh/MocA family oxidoreductase [Planctomycetales bacterium ZRK34]|nr:Gfo/Idh/MocA family oxidoreductase [Planctomycetales bacterium ZRK34]